MQVSHIAELPLDDLYTMSTSSSSSLARPASDGDYPYDLGSYSLPIETNSPEAQIWFDRGLNWSYAFHHEEAERCFRYALACDDTCAMAYWGVAYAGGPNYNKAWERFDEDDLRRSLQKCHLAVTKAQEYAIAPLESALANALATRFPSNREGDYKEWNLRFADAMKDVHDEFNSNLDVNAIYADSMMALAPWKLWDLQTGKPREDSRTLTIKSVLEHSFTLPGATTHPGLLHFYIHLMELSPIPETALPAADRLRGLVPDGGHLNHMPGHLDLLIGDYRRAISSNLDAIRGDEKYMRTTCDNDFYTFYRLHDYTFPIYAGMFNGQYKVAIETVERMEESLSDEFLRTPSPPMIDWMEGFKSFRVHVYVRFGKWKSTLR